MDFPCIQKDERGSKLNYPDHPIQVLIIGPGPVQVGGVATFIKFILQSAYLNEQFAITHMDTSRNVEDLATAGRFSFRNMSYFIFQVFDLFKTLRTIKPQIVHFSVTAGWSFWKISTFQLISHAFKVKVVAHMHGGVFKEFFDRSSPIVKKMIAWNLNRSDVVVALSAWWKEFYLQQISPTLNIEVIFNCPEEAFAFCENAQNPDERTGNTILFVGSIGKRKGIFDILEAIPLVINEYGSAQFIFLGKEEFLGENEQVQEICVEKKLDQYVSFLGHVIGAEKYRHYQYADIFILPSHAENLPFSVLEAMAMGLPVVSTPVGGIPEIV